MNFIILSGLPIIGPIFDLLVKFMGIIMDLIFRVTSLLGIQNIGICIILFTIVTRILMFPLSYNQGKSQKLMNAVQPEMKAIQKKYAGKTDQNSQMMQQAEMKALYEKYGVSMTGGCGQLIIQMPIIFALYQVILNIPAYVQSVAVPFNNVIAAVGEVTGIENVPSAIDAFARTTEELTKLITSSRIDGGIIDNADKAVKYLYHLNPAQWTAFQNNFSQVGSKIAQYSEEIAEMNDFLGLNLATSPSAYGLLSIKAWIIPVLAGLAQYGATTLMQQQQQNAGAAADDNNQMAQTMKTMNLMMPLMSVVFCFSFASGIGIYWITSSVLMGVQQYFLNKHFAKADLNEMIRKNIEKANAKRAKKGLPPIDENTAEQNFKKMQEKMERLESKQQEKSEKAREAVSKSDEYYELNSIADRARMIEQYNNKKKSNK